MFWLWVDFGYAKQVKTESQAKTHTQTCSQDKVGTTGTQVSKQDLETRRIMLLQWAEHRKDQLVSFNATTDAYEHHLCASDFQKDNKEQTIMTDATKSHLTTHLFTGLTCEANSHLICMQTSKCKVIWKDLGPNAHIACCCPRKTRITSSLVHNLVIRGHCWYEM